MTQPATQPATQSVPPAALRKHYLLLRYAIKEEEFDNASSAISVLADINEAFRTVFVGITEEVDAMVICLLWDEKYDSSDKVSSNKDLENESNVLKFTNEIKQSFDNFQVYFILESSEIIVEENWNAEWEASIEPVWVPPVAAFTDSTNSMNAANAANVTTGTGTAYSVVITPSWKRDNVEQTVAVETLAGDRPLIVVINPQMSFGTGHHETTRMMSSLLAELVNAGSTWIDAGTGTGALAIIAAKQGAEHVFAFDNDEWSVANTKENLLLNDLLYDDASHNSAIASATTATTIRAMQADVHTVALPDAHGIAANLHRNLLLGNLDRFHAALRQHRGVLLVSGLLNFDEAEVVRAASDAGFAHIRTLRENDWCAIHFAVQAQ
jgi:ribosomal protein L11 methylase PrmA